MINEEMARRFWPGDDPVGKRLKYGLDPSAKAMENLIGVVADMRRQRLDEPAIPYMFQPGVSRRWISLSARSAIPRRYAMQSAAQLHELDPSAPA